MLVLTRRISETMMVGDDVNITILGVKGNQVRLGINAAPHIPVHREEIYRKIKAEEGQGGLNDSAFRFAKSKLNLQGDRRISH